MQRLSFGWEIMTNPAEKRGISSSLMASAIAGLDELVDVSSIAATGSRGSGSRWVCNGFSILKHIKLCRQNVVGILTSYAHPFRETFEGVEVKDEALLGVGVKPARSRWSSRSVR